VKKLLILTAVLGLVISASAAHAADVMDAQTANLNQHAQATYDAMPVEAVHNWNYSAYIKTADGIQCMKTLLGDGPGPMIITYTCAALPAQ
jgi:hypothetical protein